nr:hypothetical protein Iba_chr01bCG6650 [Ipomoea batatas]
MSSYSCGRSLHFLFMLYRGWGYHYPIVRQVHTGICSANLSRSYVQENLEVSLFMHQTAVESAGVRALQLCLRMIPRGEWGAEGLARISHLLLCGLKMRGRYDKGVRCAVRGLWMEVVVGVVLWLDLYRWGVVSLERWARGDVVVGDGSVMSMFQRLAVCAFDGVYLFRSVSLCGGVEVECTSWIVSVCCVVLQGWVKGE